MDLSGVTVEVRNKGLQRMGQIANEDLDCEVTPIHNGIGAWKLTLRRGHPLASVLSTPGSGLIVSTDTQIVMSGPTTQPELSMTAEDTSGSITFTGVSDTVILDDALTFPQPSNSDATTQTVATDKRAGTVENLMHGYVNDNIGPNGSAARRKFGLIMGDNQGRGTVVSKSVRFLSLYSVVKELADSDSFGFRVVQRGSNLVFETYKVSDKSRMVRLSIENGNINRETVATAPPTITRAIVGGTGLDVNRAFLAADTPDSLAAETAWGRRIERFVNATQTIDVNEYQQAAKEALANGGKVQNSLQIVPSETSGQRFGADWWVGDLISVEVDGIEQTVLASGAILKISEAGLLYGVTVGDGAAFDPIVSLATTLSDVKGRVAYLETSGSGVILGSRYRLGNYNFSYQVYERVQLNAADDGGIEYNSNNEFVIPQDGVYQMNGGIRFGGGAGTRAARLDINGNGMCETVAQSTEETAIVTRTLRLKANDRVSLAGLQYASNPGLVFGGNHNTWLDVVRLG